MRVESQLSYAELVWREPFGVAETPAEYVFPRPKLYLDTTIPSYLAARVSRDSTVARHQRVTSRWWIQGVQISTSEYRVTCDMKLPGAIRKLQTAVCACVLCTPEQLLERYEYAYTRQ